MSTPDPEYDDLFIYAPSFILYERGELTEGKAIGTAQMADLTMVANQLAHFTDPEGFAHERKVGQTVGRAKLNKTKQNVKPVITRLLNKYVTDKIDEKELRIRMVKVMKSAWRDVYLAGVRSSGVKGEGQGAPDLVHLKPGEDIWLKGDMAHEMRFLNKFIADVTEGTWKMPLERRASMYVDALNSFYESARVIGMPNNVVIHWTGPNNKVTCPGCRYLFEHNPYTKFTLPTTPRAGLTPCLTNCRDRLLLRIVSPKVVYELDTQTLSRTTHIKNLRKIKRGG